MRVRLAAIGLLVLFRFSVNAQSISGLSRNTFPIVAWYSLTPPYDTHENYQKMADAGFNLSLSFFSNIDDAEQSLRNAKGTGVKLIISCPELRRNTEGAVQRLKGYKTLAGYYVKDEPSLSEFESVAKSVEKLKSLDPKHFAYVNILPNYASSESMGCVTYEDYISKFLETVPVEFLSFDHYPVTRCGLRKNFNSNLSIAASECGEKQIPFWGFVRTCADKSYPKATLAEMRFQIASNLAYGCGGIQYFTYQALDSSTECLLNMSGGMTDIFNEMQQANRELSRISSIFLKEKFFECSNADRDRLVELYGFSFVPSEPVLCSTFISKHSRYVMVVSLTNSKSTQIKIASSKSLKAIKCDKSIKLKDVSDIALGSGEYIVIKL